MTMRAWSFALLVLGALILVALTGCGKQCSPEVVKREKLTFGTLEQIQCKEGWTLESVAPHIIPGGIVTHVVATCYKTETVCK